MEERGRRQRCRCLFDVSRIKSLETDEGGNIIKKEEKNARGLAYVEKNE